ncbi:PREDICTED: protein toll-like [Polistes dominula]|uniref:Protein toll-like n=1 Tax=Polistes dominula TaxID=743375 RepID=A0ABM1JBN9_POLDO|nr:PREDICTED: protein toll-like [Polistes dominula]
MEGNSLININFEAFSTNEQLSIAKFSYNRLQFSNSFNMFSPFYSNHLLKELHLSNNTIKHFYSDWTTNKQKLELLDLRHNDISTISANNFIFSSNKVLVDLRYNNISNILLTNIEKLVTYNTVKRNVIVRVENNPVLCDCHLYNLLRYYNGDMPINVYNLFELKLGNLTCVKPNEKDGLQFNLMYFKTYQCPEDEYFQIVDRHPSLCTSMIRPYDQTRIIDCSNKLKPELKINKNTINLEGNYPLILNLTGNYLREIPSLDYIESLNLTHLLLSNNYIFEISLNRLPKTIQVLELHNNNLLSMSYNVSEFLFHQNYKELTLSGNPFVCGCDDRFIYVFVLQLQSIHEDLKNVKCQAYDTPLGSMTVDELCLSTDPS